jgi:hypothetical protein
MNDKKKRGPYTFEGKICKVCLKDLTGDNSRDCDIRQANYICISCIKGYNKQRYIEKKEIIREQQRIYDLSIKCKIIEAYGGECACCGETTLEFLTINCTKNNDVEKQEKNNKKSGGKLYRWLIKNDFPKEGYQIFCHNCNCAREFFGYCPHSKSKTAIELG